MAMPPDGSSSWYHHSDTWQLLDGAAFAHVIAEVSGSRASITMPRQGMPFDHFYVITLIRTDARLTIELAGPEGLFELPWSEDAPALPDSHRTIYPQKQFGGPMRDAPPLGTLRSPDANTIELVDAYGRVRAIVHRGGTTGHSVCGGALTLEFPAHEGTTVSQAKSSPP